MKNLRLLIFGLGLMIVGVLGIMIFGMDSNPIGEIVRYLPVSDKTAIGSIWIYTVIIISVLNIVIGFVLACCGAFAKEREPGDSSQE